MISHELHIGGFGKWRDRTFSFAPGLNLFTAPNEAGKTTLLQALIASLYGLKRDYVRVTRYLEEYDLYMPWDKGSYETIVRYQLAGETFRLHRRFEKEREQAKLYLEPELAEITRQYQEDRRKEWNFLERHLGLNRTLFADVTWVRRQPLAAAEHLMPSLVHVNDNDPLVQELLAGIDQELAAIGKKETAENTLLGKAVKQVALTRQALEQAEADWRSVQHLTQALQQWQAELDRLYKRQQEALALLKETQLGEREWQQWWQRSFELTGSSDLARWESAAATETERKLHRSTRERLSALEELAAACQLDLAATEPAMAEPDEGGEWYYLSFAEIGEEEWQTWLRGWYAVAAYEERISASSEEPASVADVERLQADYRRGWELSRRREEQRRRHEELVAVVAERERAFRQAEERLHERERLRQARDDARAKADTLRQSCPHVVHYDQKMAEQAKALLAAGNQSSTAAVGETQSRRYRTAARRQKRSGASRLVATAAGLSALLVAFAWLADKGTAALGIGVLAAMLVALAVLWRRSTAGKRKESALPLAGTADEVRLWLEQMGVRETTDLIRLEQLYAAWLEANRQADMLTEQLRALEETDLESGAAACRDAYEQARQSLAVSQCERDELEAEWSGLLAAWGAADWEAFLALRESRLAAIHAWEARRKEAEECQRIKHKLQAQMLRWGVPPHLPFEQAVALVLQEHEAWERRSREEQERLERQLAEQRLRAQRTEELERLEQDRKEVIAAWEEAARSLLQTRREEMERQRKEAEQRLREIDSRIGQLREQIAEARGEIGQRDQVSWAKARSACDEAALQLDELLLRRDALQLARDSLQAALTEWRRELSPDVNEAASRVAARITGGRYEDVRLDPSRHFAIRTVDPTYREVVEQHQLSTGTQDQLYLAQRVALLRRLSQEREPLPLFLDDHFIHYDDERLQRTLSYLLELAREHQVFLFSCQEREERLLAPLFTGDERHRIHRLGA